MKTILRGLGWVVGAVVLCAILVTVYARFQDGPVGAIAGGPLAKGDWVATEGLDWAFTTDIDTIEFQLLEPPRSRTVWVIYHDGSAYIPCGLPHFTLWKQWPHEAVADGRAVIRSGGKRYAVNLVKSEDSAERAAVLDLVEKKYGSAGPEDRDLTDLVWVFRLEARPVDG